MKQRAKIIINPAAGANSTHRKWPQIRSCIENTGLSFDYQLTEGKGHAIELAKAAAGDGYRYLVAVGGDGTIHEVANGIMETSRAAITTLGVVFTGTGCDLSRSVGISHDHARACLALAGDRRKKIDVGLVEYRRDGTSSRRYFLNAAGIGFDATVVEATDKLPKYFGGTLPYFFGLVRSFLSYHNKKVTLRIGDREPEQATVLSTVVANGRYFGGGMQVAPEARLDDGLLDILIIGDFGKLELLRVFPRVYKGTHVGYPKIRSERDSRVSIESSERFLLHADGELLGEGPASFSLLPEALEMVV
jgi:diacylglycerol kinase (ATP)